MEAEGLNGSGAAASLDGFVGAHPGALEQIYRGARPADPGELGASPRGRLLGVAPLSRVFLLARPVLRALATDLLPWQGKLFDHGGNSGQDRVLGRKAFRFHAEVAASRVDGRPALVLRYGEPAYRNPWPVRAMTGELRSVGAGVAIGPSYFNDELLLWWGLEARASGATGPARASGATGPARASGATGPARASGATGPAQ